MIYFSSYKYNKECINEFLYKLTVLYPLFFQEPFRIFEIIKLFKLDDSETITSIIETDYVDRQYRDSYYSYFSQKYSEIERNCLRLAFFEGKVEHTDFREDISELKNKLIGTIVLRPLNVGNIGLTLLNPRKLKFSGYVQTCRFKIMICGRKFTIRAFPFLTQDNETMTCAETAVFNLIQYYSEKYREYRIVMPSEILKVLEASSYERVLPSNGVEDLSIGRILQAEHLHPRFYSCRTEGEQSFDELFYAYVDSGIPFIVGLPQHAVVCIGHSKVDFELENHNLKDIVSCDIVENNNIYSLCTASLIDEYVFMDDNQPPYVVSTIDHLTEHYFKNGDYSFDSANFCINDDVDDVDDEPEETDKTENEHSVYTIDALKSIKKRFDSILVPLSRRIFLDASRARSIFDEHFLKNPDFIYRIQEAYSDMSWGNSEENPLVWRMYLASSNSYKDFRCRMAPNEELFNYYSSESYPRFIWVLEIGTLETFSNKAARVEVILDATSSHNSRTWAILSIRYKCHLVFVPNISFKQIIGVHQDPNSFDDSPEYGSIDWEALNDDIRGKTLTSIFKTLYHTYVDFVGSTYEVFSNQNLKEV